MRNQPLSKPNQKRSRAVSPHLTLVRPMRLEESFPASQHEVGRNCEAEEGSSLKPREQVAPGELNHISSRLITSERNTRAM